MSSQFPKLSLVIGGAASGKSKFAEELVTSSSLPKVYIATAQAFDDEMRAKIERHRTQRGADWELMERAFAMPEALSKVGPGKVVLVDCLTIWLSNFMLAKMPVEKLAGELLAATATCASPVVVVSNETGQGVVPESELGRSFRQEQGMLNQRVAAASDLVIKVVAGLPMVLKGEMPEGFHP